MQSLEILKKLEQLECLCSEDTSRRLMITLLLSHIEFLNSQTNFTRNTPPEVAW